MKKALWIRLPYDYVPSPDLVATVLAQLCGTAFSEISIDLPIGDELHKVLSQATRADIKHLPGKDVRRRSGRNSALNFSGGFDSLAARALAPDSALVSLDFGGRFARERLFFQEFDPLILATNLTELGLNRYGWQFMGMGSVLLRDELDLASYSFGSIMAATMPRLYDGPQVQSSTGLSAGEYLGMQVKNPVSGLSEIASLMVVLRAAPTLVPRSLLSLAGRREDKFRRKHLMLRAVSKRLELELSLENLSPLPRPKAQWGASLRRT